MNGLLSVIVAQRAVSVQMRSQWYCSPATGGKTAVIAARHPFEAELEAAKRYAWCACGYSKKQPFCDGTHKTVPSAPEPLRFKLEEAKKKMDTRKKAICQACQPNLRTPQDADKVFLRCSYSCNVGNIATHFTNTSLALILLAL
ncbi:uncharacterized protein [Scyliorhinus torazame]|uniref:uncharacterized protein isoform X1 n=1 Tax=Scyliorhinus torazame TaxID=75743 RepID=UPI003B5AC641